MLIAKTEAVSQADKTDVVHEPIQTLVGDGSDGGLCATESGDHDETRCLEE